MYDTSLCKGFRLSQMQAAHNVLDSSELVESLLDSKLESGDKLRFCTSLFAALEEALPTAPLPRIRLRVCSEPKCPLL